MDEERTLPFQHAAPDCPLEERESQCLHHDGFGFENGTVTKLQTVTLRPV